MQIPSLVVGEPSTKDIVQLQDNWVVVLKRNLPSMPRHGFLYWSPWGYEACHHHFCPIRGASWEDFEQSAREHFDNMRAAVDKKVARLEAQITKLKGFKVKYG